MNSTFTWLDYSEWDRRRMAEIIDNFREKGSRDELGFDTIAFTFSEMLFPGTAAAQSRARYFLFVPWMYQIVEEEHIAPATVGRRLRDLEVRLMDAILGSEDDRGLIGRQSRENLQRLPSYLYWHGLKTWQILLFPGSQDQYHASLGTLQEQRRRSGLRSDDGEPLQPDAAIAWHPSLPKPPEDFLERSSFRMTDEEAGFLRERIQASEPETLLSFLVGIGEEHDRVTFPWQHPASGDFPEHIGRQLHHARAFSEIAFGATLLYNHMLAEKASALRGESPEAVPYGEDLEEWADLVESSETLASWDTDEFWRLIASEGARIPTPTRIFVDSWCELAMAPGGTAKIASNERARTLVKDRELARNRAQARLSNPRALELWSGSSGVFRHAYRWSAAYRLLSDIADGIGR